MKILLFLVYFAFNLASIAQQQAISSGGTATGSGSAEYTVGQVFYTEKTGSGSVMEGVNQPEEVSVLPITLYYFNAEPTAKGYVQIQWRTLEEINNKLFIVERSIDGKKWILITSKPGAGNSSLPQNYEYVDTQPVEGISYYRLVQEDYDGTRVHFDAVIVELNAIPKVKIYPNPVLTNINLIGLPSASEYILFDQSGKRLSSGLVQGSSIDATAFPAGIYTLVLKDETKNIIHRQKIKVQ